MNIFIATETIMYKVEDNLYVSNSFKNVIKRYKKFFGNITLCTRVTITKNEYIPNSYDCVNEIITEYIPIKGLKEFVKGDKHKEMNDAISKCDLVVSRVPSIIAYKAASLAQKYSIPYMVEVVGCTWDAYWNYSLFGKVIAPIALYKMKKTVAKANYATYVTEHFLQDRYPCKCESIHCSNVLIDECNDNIYNNRIEKIKSRNKKKLIISTCAAIDVAYKGQEYVIKAIPELNKHGIEIEYRLAGFGNSERLENIAKEYDVQEQVSFLGALTHKQVFEVMDESDIYIQPSLQEGLPRSVIEAMSRACPVLGAHTAGIPELLDSECVFKPASSKSIVDKVLFLCNSDFAYYAKHNFNKSKEFLPDVLEKRRADYYEIVKTSVLNAEL